MTEPQAYKVTVSGRSLVVFSDSSETATWVVLSFLSRMEGRRDPLAVTTKTTRLHDLPFGPTEFRGEPVEANVAYPTSILDRP